MMREPIRSSSWLRTLRKKDGSRKFACSSAAGRRKRLNWIDASGKMRMLSVFSAVRPIRESFSEFAFLDFARADAGRLKLAKTPAPLKFSCSEFCKSEACFSQI